MEHAKIKDLCDKNMLKCAKQYFCTKYCITQYMEKSWNNFVLYSVHIL